MGFIEEITPLIQKYAPQYNVAVVSPIIAQAILESASGTSELGQNACNYFGLKYHKEVSSKSYIKKGSEQNPDGSYTSSVMTWCKFDSMEQGVEGYFKFLFCRKGITRYDNLKNVSDPKTYLDNIKLDGYATSINYVDNLMNVIKKYNLTQYDTQEGSVEMVTIKQQIANKSNYGNTRNLSDIKYIVIHYTANDGDHDESNGSYFQRNIVKASAHYFVDSDSITQSVPDNYSAYAVGGQYSLTGGAGSFYGKCTNANSISIELCDDVKNGVIYPSQKTIDNALELTKTLMKKYNVPASNVIRHYDVNGKKCPAYWVDNTKWKNEFWNKLSGQVSTPAPTPAPTITDTSFKVKVICDELNIRAGAGTGYKVVGTIKKGGVYTIVEKSGTWGKLKSGAGWISILSKYVQNV